MEQDPQSRIAATAEQMPGSGLFNGLIKKAQEHPVIASLVTAGALAVSGAAVAETSQAHHVVPDPNEGFEPCIELEPGVTQCYGPGPSRAVQCMNNWRNQAANGYRINNGVPLNYNGKPVKSTVRLRYMRPAIKADERPNSRCTKNEFYSGVKSWLVAKMDGNTRRASSVVTVARNTSAGFNKQKTLRLNRHGRTIIGNCAVNVSVRTQMIGVSRESNDRDVYNQYDSAKRMNLKRSCKR